MPSLIVTNGSDEWTNQIQNATVVDARAYLTDPAFNDLRAVKVFNLCRSYKYQTIGYYVSLLAEARGHKPLPSVSTVQDLRSRAIVRMISDELETLIQKGLESIKSEEFTLSIYFGRNMARRYDRLALQLFNQFPSPLLRAHFVKTEGRWVLRRVTSISASDVPPSHWPFIVSVADAHLAGRRSSVRKKQESRFDLAILCNPQDHEPPSNEKALQKFVKAATAEGLSAEIITRDDYGRLAEFDALFIRDTTFVNQYTYRFSRRAAGEGLVVIDDPQSILRCTNKVYLAELLARHKVATPKSIVVHRGNADQVGDQLGFPCVLKRPDSAFSRGVVNVSDPAELRSHLDDFFDESDLVLAQEFLPTTFDWRIGIIDHRPLYACKYFMAHGHWQVVQRERTGRVRYGKLETIPVELAPHKAVKLALKATDLIGDGLYGVDVKESDGKFYIIEVNDNPNIDAGCEDAILKDELYRRIMNVFVRRIEARKAMFP